MHCKADVQTQSMYHPTCIYTWPVANGAQAVGWYVAQESSPREWMGIPIPDLAGWDWPFCPVPGTTQPISALTGLCQHMDLALAPQTRSKHHPETLLLPRCCSQITIYCVLLTRCVCHRTEKGSCILQLSRCFKLMTIFFAMCCGLGEAARPSFKCRINTYDLIRSPCF